MELRSRGQAAVVLGKLEVGNGNDEATSTKGVYERRKRKSKRRQVSSGRVFTHVAISRIRLFLRKVRQESKAIPVLKFLLVAFCLVKCFNIMRGRFSTESNVFKPNTVFLNEMGFQKVYFTTKYPDYGGLKMDFYEDNSAQRQIHRDFELLRRDYRLPSVSRDDDLLDYYDFDDDYERGQNVAGSGDDSGRQCRRTREHRIDFRNCNTIHEQHLVESGINFLGSGTFREVFSIKDLFDGKNIVMKDLCFQQTIDLETMEYVRMDAMVADRLHTNPRTYDIFGFCGLSIFSEFFLHGDIEATAVPGDGFMEQKDLKDEKELKPQNKLTGAEKLVLSLEMAEGIAVMHGNTDGIIVHDDIQLPQFLFNEDKSMLKINDFNRAEFMFWDEEYQEYCPYRNGRGHGNWRSPEEYKDDPLDESIDVWSLGNNMYSILTGLNPFYNMKIKEMQKALIRGEIAYIDPRYKERSKEESKLAEIIELCFTYNPKERPTIFFVVAFLQQAVLECLGDISRKDILSQIKLEEVFHEE